MTPKQRVSTRPLSKAESQCTNAHVSLCFSPATWGFISLVEILDCQKQINCQCPGHFIVPLIIICCSWCRAFCSCGAAIVIEASLGDRLSGKLLATPCTETHWNSRRREQAGLIYPLHVSAYSPGTPVSDQARHWLPTFSHGDLGKRPRRENQESTYNSSRALGGGLVC